MLNQNFTSEELANKFESYLNDLKLQSMNIETKENCLIAIVFSEKPQEELMKHFSSCVRANKSCKDIFRVMLVSSDFEKINPNNK
ncbi:hypothetical protein DAC20_184 [Bacteroides phage DAC20]|jgi:hypothetical protein|nr:hypothetical protein DAC16_179 [Bacteroides phage DAC16]QIG63673.1 hypothetical protein DAC19_185 [Bacteroides phage DAC19]QIG63934.1 hypothetical protein DAC20_184 [Bacteroides phage DAC20]QIG64198.1 hypothetical protein DAC22_187 [Bacteroides phage DAC22]QIG64454.1 hypothetical protein DAC23_179 [Bacteroides phage DAC23]QIG64859.1 hypothetical protein SJC03_184 [Bacteroides phage SJC03]